VLKVIGSIATKVRGERERKSAKHWHGCLTSSCGTLRVEQSGHKASKSQVECVKVLVVMLFGGFVLYPPKKDPRCSSLSSRKLGWLLIVRRNPDS